MNITSRLQLIPAGVLQVFSHNQVLPRPKALGLGTVQVPPVQYKAASTHMFSPSHQRPALSMP